MPNPKHKHSKSRRDKRRTHYKATAPTLAIDACNWRSSSYGIAHSGTKDKLMYKGKIDYGT
jgi:large subunit ribosomal protein L32